MSSSIKKNFYCAHDFRVDEVEKKEISNMGQRQRQYTKLLKQTLLWYYWQGKKITYGFIGYQTACGRTSIPFTQDVPPMLLLANSFRQMCRHCPIARARRGRCRRK